MIYILLLYQLYSLIHFSEKIEYELSADAKDYLKAPEAYNLKLKEIQAEINTFLLKSVHTSVSQMQTQNDFYQFAKKNLRLREEIQSLTAGVDFLEELLETQEEQRRQEKENAELLQRQQEEDKLSVGVLFCRCLAIIAFADGIGFLNEIKEAGSLMNLCRENIAYPIILVIVVLIWALWRWLYAKIQRSDTGGAKEKRLIGMSRIKEKTKDEQRQNYGLYRQSVRNQKMCGNTVPVFYRT